MYYGFPAYVSVADKKHKAEKVIARLRKKGKEIKPVAAFSGKMAQTFWGRAWCQNLESCADYENRLGRGRSYVRSGCVCHVDILPGQVRALVNGSALYNITVNIKALDPLRWRSVCETCAGQVGSVLELLQGKISKKVMEIVSDPARGIFPSPEDMSFDCSCPDWASMCKHVAAVLYGIGRRLDAEPELLFTLRGVNAADIMGSGLNFAQDAEKDLLHSDDLGALFGIDLVMDAPSSLSASPGVVADHAQAGASPDKTEPKVRGKDKASSAAKSPKLPRAPFNAARPTGVAIAKLRRLAKLAPAAFAQALGVSFATLDRWEESKGALRLRSDSIEKLTFFQKALLENLQK